MKKISLKSQRKMEQDAARGKWYNLVELRRVPEFAAGMSWRCGTHSYALKTINFEEEE